MVRIIGSPTLKSNQVNRRSMLCDAEGMILHAWTVADISQDHDLYSVLALAIIVITLLIFAG